MLYIHDENAGSISKAEGTDGKIHVCGYVWNTGTLAWDRETQAGGGGGGDATAANQVTQSGILQLIEDALSMDYKDSGRIDFSSTTITSGAWTTLIASTAAAAKSISVMNAADAIEIGVGGGGSEARKLLVPPGGFDTPVPITLAAGVRLSVRAVGAASISLGEVTINLFG